MRCLSCVCVQVIVTAVVPFPGAAEGVSLHLCPGSTCGGPVRSPSPQWAHFRGQRGGKAQACPPRPPNTPSPLLPASAQALSLKESEKTALSEKLMGTQHSLAAISLEMERQKRDAQSRQEQDRVGQAGRAGLHLSRGWGWGGHSPARGGDVALPWGQHPGCRRSFTLPWESPLEGGGTALPCESPSLGERPAPCIALARRQGISRGPGRPA